LSYSGLERDTFSTEHNIITAQVPKQEIIWINELGTVELPCSNFCAVLPRDGIFKTVKYVRAHHV
jgi:hypothetical protein